MKKSLIKTITLFFALSLSAAQAGGRGNDAGGGLRMGGQTMGQRQGGYAETMRREQSRFRLQQFGQYQQGNTERRREMNQYRFRRSVPVGGVAAGY